MRHIRALCTLAFVLMSIPACSQSEGSGVLPPFGQNPATVSEVRKGMEEVARLVIFFCSNIYPRPTEAECIDKVKHAIGESADPHSQYLNADEFKKFSEGMSGQFGGIGIEIFKGKNAPVLVINAMEGSPAARVGILAGDIITHIVIDNTPTSTMSLKKSDDVVSLIRGQPGTSVKLQVTRKGVPQKLEFVVVREIIRTVNVEGNLVVDGDKVYINIKAKAFQDNVAREVEQKYADLKRKAGAKLAGLILTFENNPGGSLSEAYNLIRLFDDSDDDVILTRSNDGIESYVPPERLLLHKNPRSIAKDIPILIVVNGRSASASEVVAKSLQHKRIAVIAGTGKTFGKGVVQTVMPSSDGGAIKWTSAEYLIGTKTDWVPVQCVGVGLDIQFEYPGIKPRESLSECDLNGHVSTGGLMPNAPTRLPIKDANPALYRKAMAMLEAYKQYALPKLLADEELRKRNEKLEQE